MRMRMMAVVPALLLAACGPPSDSPPGDPTDPAAYLRTHAATHYRALDPYYVHQRTQADCSAASTTMLVNALLRLSGSTEPPVTEAQVLRAVGDRDWIRAVADNGEGVTFSAFLRNLRSSLDAFGLPTARIDVFHPTDSSPETRRHMHAMLAAAEHDPRSFLVAVFDQGTLTGTEHVGHVSPVGAYDPVRRRTLILDVDRGIGPYWADEDKLLAALLYPDATDPSGNGLVRVSLPLGMARSR